MKNSIIYLFAVLLSIVILSGCEAELDESPKTFVSPDAFYTSAESYELTVIGIYRTIPRTLGYSAWLTRETFSDIMGQPSPAYEQGLPVFQNNHQPFFYNVRDQWTNFYAIVKDANFILDKIEGSAILSENEKNRLSAEARFMRGYAYYNLVQLYGDVPLRTKPVTDIRDVQISRTDQKDIYDFLLDDLVFAETHLSNEAPSVGRVYKLVATALLAKVYLTMAGSPLNETKYYSDARDKATEVLNSLRFELRPDYSEVFHNTVYTSESIWEQTYQPGIGGNPLMVNSATAPGYVYILTPAAWFINSFPVGDRRKSWGIQENYVAPSGVLSPFFQKFVNNGWLDEGVLASGAGRLEYTIPLLRLAEMYLIAAEVENELNGPANAYQYINAIRERARIDKSDPTHVPDLNGLTKDSFRDAVLMERKWELHLEGSTWYDLKRTGTLNRIQDIRSESLVHPIGDYNNTWYIPDVEIQNNNIAQNPAYE